MKMMIIGHFLIRIAFYKFDPWKQDCNLFVDTSIENNRILQICRQYKEKKIRGKI